MADPANADPAGAEPVGSGPRRRRRRALAEAGIIILVSIVFLTNQVLSRIEARVLRWQPSSQAVHVEV